MASRILAQPFDPWQAMHDYRSDKGADSTIGAAASFVGTMRGYNDKGALTMMTLEHYPKMTERYLAQIDQAAKARYTLTDSLIIHRVGIIYPAQPIVLIACWSAHRRAALNSLSWLIDKLKTDVPLWKKEMGLAGDHWPNNT